MRRLSPRVFTVVGVSTKKNIVTFLVSTELFLVLPLQCISLPTDYTTNTHKKAPILSSKYLSLRLTTALILTSLFGKIPNILSMINHGH